jgi:hypothetical protein
MLSSLLSTVWLLSGCGGGGGGGGATTNTPPTNTITAITLVGTLTDSSSNAIVDGKVVDSTDNISATSGSGGAFSLAIPAADSGTTVSFGFYNSSNQEVLVQNIAITASSGQTQNLGSIVLGPPGPPVNPGLITK